MTHADKLTAFLAADRAPAFDPAFIAGFAERMARLRLYARLRRLAVWAIAAAAIGYGLYAASGPAIVQDALGFTGDLARTPGLMLAALIVAAGVVLPRWLPRRLRQ